MKVPSSIFISVILSLIIISCSSNIKPLPQNVEASENPIKECPNSPNCFRTTQYFDQDSSAVFSSIQSAIKELNAHNIEIVDNSKTQSLDAVFKIPIFGWLDDVKVLVVPDKNNMNNTFVHLKSSSRKGYYDIGVNKRRINRILKVARKKLTNK
tara:strand:- start:9332 stop:9793 length:462 start_codon:yes stop_codon:yes gene_type:complete